MDEQALERRRIIDNLFSETFNSILRVEEKSLDNRLTHGLTITEIHALVAVGYRECNPMNVVAARLDVTLATLNASMNRLAEKGFVQRMRDEGDRRRVLLSLTKRGRQVYRAHSLFHKNMIDEALAGLDAAEEQALAQALAKLQAFFDRQSR